MEFPVIKQTNLTDCGPTCLQMVAKYYGKIFRIDNLREKCYNNRGGTTLLGISKGAEKIGFRTLGVSITFEQLYKKINLPCIIHWQNNHFVVVYKIIKKRNKYTIKVADPSIGAINYNYEEFCLGWKNSSDEKVFGSCLILETSPRFFEMEEDSIYVKGIVNFFYSYLKPFKKLILHLFASLILANLIGLIFPFFTQSIVDRGIIMKDLEFIFVILMAQLILSFAKASIEYIRSLVLIYLSTRINVSLISDFITKLLKLPLKYFDTKRIGDLFQRIDDHSRIESFISTSVINSAFTVVTILIYSSILFIYNKSLFLVFFIGSIFYCYWILMFMKKREELDYKSFLYKSNNKSNIFQLLTGIIDIRLSNSGSQKRWDWENIQANLFKVNLKSNKVEQLQSLGGNLINQIKNFIIIYLTAKSVINGNMTLGMMLSVQYIIGALNEPIGQLLLVFKLYQDAKLSLRRISEIHLLEDDDKLNEGTENKIPDNKTIHLDNVSFTYESDAREIRTLDNLNFVIPQNKITAIVGTSGSGKTTLLKLLLMFYKPTNGNILIDGTNIKSINNEALFDNCGVVLQESRLFTDTVLNNIVLKEDDFNAELFSEAAEISNIKEFVEELPQEYDTIIGEEGRQLSLGQKQRILIARAIYKDPPYLLFDEATNALDAYNENNIMTKLYRYFKGKTVIIVAHRLSTVKNADQIVVLKEGKIVEIGKHAELLKNKKEYYRLVKNQLG
ncbi:MAG: peptidase domain-containing ABC transporter [Candidatus Odinarchaeota archaeon]